MLLVTQALFLLLLSKQTIGHRLRLNEYILYVFGQTRRPLAVSRAKICPGSRPEVSSTPSI